MFAFPGVPISRRNRRRWEPLMRVVDRGPAGTGRRTAREMERGTVTFWCLGQDELWRGDDRLAFQVASSECGLSVVVVKHRERLVVELRVSGRRATFACPAPPPGPSPSDRPGIFVAIRWSKGRAALFLNAHMVGSRALRDSTTRHAPCFYSRDSVSELSGMGNRRANCPAID